MCTAVCFRQKYFGRNFDLDTTYGEKIIIVPRNFLLKLRKSADIARHNAIIGIGTVRDGYPLFYDCVNEKGLAAAGLNLPFSTKYSEPSKSGANISPFELLPYVLSCCDSIADAKKLLEQITLANIPFSESLPLSPLHWIFSDKEGSIVFESTSQGTAVYPNPINVLTNEPPFPFHLSNLNFYMHLSPHTPQNAFSAKLPLYTSSFGMGSIGLPGDLSSASRFVRAAFTSENSLCDSTPSDEIIQFFHILDSVAQPLGLAETRKGNYEFTRYSSCCDLEACIYCYKTYKNSRITAVDLYREWLDANMLITYPLDDSLCINFQN